jgi:alpha-glucosidase
LALLVQALPGSVYVYQGEELGLEDVELPDSVRQDPVFFRSQGAQKGRDGARVPMPWSGDVPPYGFTGPALTTWLPQPEDWRDYTVERESADPLSTLNLYRVGLHMRRDIPDESLTFLDTSAGLLAFNRGNQFVCVINCTNAEMDLPVHGEVLLSSRLVESRTVGVIPALTTMWLRVS